MGFIGYILGELFVIIGGIYCYLIFSGKKTPTFKTEKDKEKHQKLLASKGKIFSILGLILVVGGTINLLRKISAFF